MIFVFWLIICPIVGIILGSTVNKAAAGFFLGLLLGPIGWIIVLLLPRDEPTAGKASVASTSAVTPPSKSTVERDLSTDQYKIYLVKKYSIEKNDALGKIICNERLFESIEDALVYADSEEQADHERRERQQQLFILKGRELEKEIADDYIAGPATGTGLTIIAAIAMIVMFVLAMWMSSQGYW